MPSRRRRLIPQPDRSTASPGSRKRPTPSGPSQAEAGDADEHPPKKLALAPLLFPPPWFWDNMTKSIVEQNLFANMGTGEASTNNGPDGAVPTKDGRQKQLPELFIRFGQSSGYYGRDGRRLEFTSSDGQSVEIFGPDGQRLDRDGRERRDGQSPELVPRDVQRPNPGGQLDLPPELAVRDKQPQERTRRDDEKHPGKDGGRRGDHHEIAQPTTPEAKQNGGSSQLGLQFLCRCYPNCSNTIKCYASRGGPDLQDLLGYPSPSRRPEEVGSSQTSLRVQSASRKKSGGIADAEDDRGPSMRTCAWQKHHAAEPSRTEASAAESIENRQ
ncbi:hypothetical protein DCS_00615 [Drechmeria coniospora]|uniref:Uncharacterized protein n=1 Tax=Drechmeria coniospora TaxID=98403 RepID=A0A151GQU3_DRECN|nr:hypothetical protein DCS_00615 [Drechmeria coniospora]KYK59485.1 hypothetical protein DCS_00615 [Drechmeria coniospora]